MSIEQDQNYLDACKIVDSYERAIRSERNEVSVLMMMEANLDFMEEILESSQSALNEMDIVDNSPESEREENTSDNNQQAALSENKDQNSCAEEKEFVSIDGATINFKSLDPVTADASELLVDPVNAIDAFLGGDGEITAEDIQKAASECFECNLKAEFDFQIKPINLLSELMPLINQIGAMLDNIINELKPFDLMANLCKMSKNIRLFCLPDLLSILVTLEGLIKRYIGEAFKLVLNWTFIVGPIIKGVVDIAATLMEQIRRLLVAPLDCAAGIIGSILDFEENAKDKFENMEAFAASFVDYDYKTKSRTLSRSMKFSPDPELESTKSALKDDKRKTDGSAEKNLTYGWEFSVNDTLASSYEKKKEQIKARNRLNKRKAAVDKLNKDPRKAQSILEKAVNNINSDLIYVDGKSPTEMELNAIEEEYERLAEQENQGILKNLLFAINEGRDWVNSLHANLLLSLKALNGLVANNLEASLKLGGWILMIFDIIKVIQLIVHFFKSGNFKSICDIMDNDPERLKDILEKDFKWAAVDLEKTQADLDEWEKQIMLFANQEELITCE
tara:strand:+ start:1837 stop:3525 length:1689 start_codon:yes stop_codon:yes gene_type:complete